MTTVAVLATPPDPETVLPDLVPEVVRPETAVDLYTAMLRDVCLAVDRSGAELLVNYRTTDTLPGVDQDLDPETAVRDVVEPVLSDPSDVRFEVQVGSTRSARIGNTVTHLLESERVATAAVVRPTAAFLARQHVDSAAMKLRGSSIVLGPAPDGRVHYAAFGAPIDFTDAFESTPLTTVTGRAREAGLDVDFVEMLPVFERPGDLSTALPALEARRLAGLPVPEGTTAVLDDLDLDANAHADGT